jgi:hypothetical protein
MRTRLYDRAVLKTLFFYETWVLPDNDTYGWPKDQHRLSLREAKLKEFRERKALLNPYDKEKLLEAAGEEQKPRLEKLSRSVNFQNCEQFTISYDRHKGLYGYRVRDFPAEYDIKASFMDWKQDPYKRDKFKIGRINLKKCFALLALAIAAEQFREAQVSEYDRLKRFEQRAMQNKEADEVNGKQARFILFDENGEQFTEQSLAANPTSYTLLWVDQKLKNYELCVNYFLTKQRITHATIQPILVVDKPATMTKV